MSCRSYRARWQSILVAVVSVFFVLAAPVPGAEPSENKPPGPLKLEPLLVTPRDAPRSQLVRLRFEGQVPAPPFAVEVTVPGQPVAKMSCRDADPVLGGFTVGVSGIEREVEVAVKASGAEWRREASVVLRPQRPWKLFLVQHTHTDIGYTALPSRLNVDHLKFIDEAVRACALTDAYPDDARFRWTCEATWAVERYVLERSPDRVADFLKRVKEGRIEVTAMKMNMTDLATEEVVVRNLLPVRSLRRRGIPVKTAMQCDVNGYPWALPELLEDIGVGGLAGGINQTRSTLPFDFPRAITWQSPSGGSVVAWRGEHYMFANMLGFRESIEKVLARLPGYLADLQRRGYPYRIALLQMAGYFTDNAAPSHRASDLVREWNERFATPQVRLATLSEWFEALRREGRAPVMRKAWPDWWADGVGSAPLESAVIRDAQEKLSFAETFLSIARVVRPDIPDRRATLRDVYLLASLYDEHTFGASESVSKPYSINTKTQWKEKASHAYKASWLATELEDAAFALWARDVVPAGEQGIAIFNSLSWERTGPVVVEVPRGIVEEGTPFCIVDPETDDEVPYQFVGAARNYRTLEMVATRVPPVGYRVYRLDVGQEPEAGDDAFLVQGAVLSNGVTRVELDADRAGIAAVEQLPDGPNLVDSSHRFALNQYVHERIADEKGRWYLWPAKAYTPGSFERFPAVKAKLENGVQGPVRRSLRLLTSISVPGPAQRVQAGKSVPPPPPPRAEVKVVSEVSLYRGLPWVWVENRVETPDNTDPVAGYFAFPFAGSEAPRADLVGGVMVPGPDQIEGSAADWHALQRWVRVPGAGGGAAWATLDAPLVQFGGFNTGRWTEGLSLEKPVFYSWVLNNYWFTNFVASQRGAFVFRYVIAGGEAGATDAAAHRFARETCSPLRSSVVDGRGGATWRASFLKVEPAHVDLVCVKEAEEVPRALVLRVRNRSDTGVSARVAFSSRLSPRSAAETSLLEETRQDLEVHDGALMVELAPWQLKTIRVGF